MAARKQLRIVSRLALGLFVLFVLFGFAGCAGTRPSGNLETVIPEIRAVLDQQARDWNAGSIERFMQGYARSDTTRFASGGDVVRGWQTVFDRYVKKYGDRALMGTLSFSDVEITPLTEETAMAFGRWHLHREKDDPSGLFTLIFRKQPDGWRIIHDHTSAAENK